MAKDEHNKNIEEDPEGIGAYIDNIILNPHLEEDLRAIGSSYTIPTTPPVQEEADGDQEQ